MEKLTKEFIIKEIQKRKEEIQKKFHVKHLTLFGSYARDEQTDISDIDILVEFENEFKDNISNELDLQVYLYNIFEKDIGLCQKEEIKEEYKQYIFNNNLESIY